MVMQCRDGEDVRKAVADNNVSFIQLWFTDVIGILKSFAITPSELAEALSEGMGFDGSSIEGFARIEESDMIAKPDRDGVGLAVNRNTNSPYYGRVFVANASPGINPG